MTRAKCLRFLLIMVLSAPNGASVQADPMPKRKAPGFHHGFAKFTASTESSKSKYGRVNLSKLFHDGVNLIQNTTVNLKPDSSSEVTRPGLSSSASVTANAASTEQKLNYYDRFLHKVFTSSDLNHNGYLDRNEAYVMTLRLYVFINRRAPIPVPSRVILYELFALCDWNKDGKLSMEEFAELVSLLTEGAVSRIAAYQTIKWLGAPLVTELIIRSWKSRHNNDVTSASWLSTVVTTIIPKRYHAIVQTETFARTLLLLVSVMCFGKLILMLVDFILAEWIQVRKACRSYVNPEPTTTSDEHNGLDEFLHNYAEVIDKHLERYYHHIERLKRRIQKNAEKQQLRSKLETKKKQIQNRLDRFVRNLVFR